MSGKPSLIDVFVCSIDQLNFIDFYSMYGR
jgi:hypothetical protein